MQAVHTPIHPLDHLFRQRRTARRGAFALLLAALAVLGIGLPATAQDATTTITLAVPEFFADIFETQIIPQFEAAHPGIRVHLEASAGFGVPVNFGDDIASYLDDMAEYVSAADVVLFDSTVLPEATRAGYFLDLLPLASSDPALNRDDFYPAVWESLQWDGGLWALPVRADAVMLFYSPAAFDAAGLAYPSADWTLDDLVNAIRALTVFDESGAVETLAFQDFDGSLVKAMLGMVGDDVIDEGSIPNGPDYSNPALEAVLAAWAQLQADGYLTPAGEGGQGVVITIGGDDSVTPITLARSQFGAAQFGPEARAGVAPLPGNQASLIVSGFGISGGTRYPDAAYALVRFLSSSPEAASVFFGGVNARRSLAGVEGEGGGPRFTFGGQLAPEVQAVIDAAYETARPASRERFADGLARALVAMSADGLDARTALNAEEAAARERLAAADARRATPISVAEPPMPVTLAPGEIALDFGLLTNIRPFPGEDRWEALAAEFAASDPEVGVVNLEADFPLALEAMTSQYACFYTTDNPVPDADLSLLRALDPLLDSDSGFDRGDVVNGVLASLSRENQTWGYPLQIQPRAMRYNAEVFAQAGIAEPVNGWNVSQFEDALRALGAYLPADTPPFTPNSFGNDYLLALIAAYGGLPFDSRTSPTTISFTDPATVEAIRQVLNLAKDGLIEYQALAAGGGRSLVMGGNQAVLTMETVGGFGFGGGGFVFSVGGDDEGEGDSAPPATPMRTTTLPSGSAYAPAAYEIGAAYISAGTPYTEACYRFIRFIAGQRALFEAMPARRSAISDPALAASHGAEKVAFYSQMAAQLEAPNTIILPTQSFGGAGANIVNFWLNRAFDRYVLEDADLDAELAAAQTATTEYLACTAMLPTANPGEGRQAFQQAMQARQECALQADPTATSFFN